MSVPNKMPANQTTDTPTVNTGKNKPTWIQLVGFVAILFGSVAVAQWLISTAPKAERKPAVRQARLVTAIPLKPTDETLQLTGYGTVSAKQQLALQSRISGTVRAISSRFIPGAQIKRGELLVELDPTDYSLELAQAKAQLAQAQAALNTELGNQAVAKSDFNMLGLSVTDEREKSLILRQPQLESAKANVAAAQARVDLAQTNLQRTRITAPFDGIVMSREVSVGSQISPTTNLGQFAGSDAFWISVAIPQANLQWIDFPQVGKAGSVVCAQDAGNSDAYCHTGRVLSLQNNVQENGRQAQVLVEIPRPRNSPKKPNSDQSAEPLLLSQYVKVTFNGRLLRQVYRIDPTHVHDGQIWILKDGKLDIRPANELFRSDDRVIIQAGIQPGELLITSALGSPVQGMLLRLPENTDKKSEPTKNSDAKP